MVFFNYATMQMAAKIVYYGPGLCGKTTNLHHIYAKLNLANRAQLTAEVTRRDCEGVRRTIRQRPPSANDRNEV